MKIVRRLAPLLAFLGGFVWDALTIGQRVRVIDLWRFGAYLFAAALLVMWLSWRASRPPENPGEEEVSVTRGRLRTWAWRAPYLLLQFFYGSIFSALFILYFKSAGHLGAWLMAALLGALLVVNEFFGRRFGQRFTLIWALFALNAVLLLNFALPHAIGSLGAVWFYLSTGGGIVLTHVLWRLSPGRLGRIGPSWALAAGLLLAWSLDMIAPVPLVKQDLAVGHDFVQNGADFTLKVEPAPAWQLWRDAASTVHLADGEKLYGVSAVFAPLGLTAPLEHRWETREASGWRVVYQRRFDSTGGRERGFRAYSWVLNPAPGDWRLVVGTQDGRTIGILPVTVARGTPEAMAVRRY